MPSKAVGKISKEDYEKMVEPLIDEARREGRQLRVLCQLGPEYEGITPAAVWKDTTVGLRSLRLFDGGAIVSDIAWIRGATRIFGFVVPCPVRVFGDQERDRALEWLRSLSNGAGISHRLIPESAVIVVDVSEPLRAKDFDALSRTADTWLATHDKLHGLVIHARQFPGWENVSSLLRHVRFVRDHHRKVNRLALASDSKFASWAPRLAEHFVRAEVKSFGYDELEKAVAWAAGS